jgi:membrane-bound serine protease (ClpP class)
LVVAFTATIGGLWALAISKAISVRRAPVRVGPQDIVGMEGEARPGGQVFVRGELWRARSDEAIRPGDRVRVAALDGLTLDVHRIDA